MNFFEHPIINSPYRYPSRHWELDGNGQPTNTIIDRRRDCRLVSPIPPPKKSKAKRSAKQETMDFSTDGGADPLDQYDPTSIVNEIRGQVEAWRKLPSPSQWGVTPETARLLQHWRSHEFHGVRPFFCQVEAVETAIWLAEVADPKRSRLGQRVRTHLDSVRESFNPELMRIALKLATGAGKTTVMAMLIAWQTINAVRHPDGKRYARGFLIVAPGITIKDRLRVLLPSDPDSYYRTREIVPPDMLPEIGKAKIVITNYHAFKLRERLSLPKTSRALLKGRGPELQTIETEGQMLQRVMSELMAFKNIVVLNDEAHHCYRQRQTGDDLKGDDREEAERNNEAARLWITGIETVKRKLGVRAVYDLSATPFFLKGSGYREGALFPWTVSDFSLMDAIECGIVKLPRVPVADNIASDEMPVYRDLWSHIGKDMPRKGRGKTAKGLDPLKLPTRLYTAMEALYGHYAKTFDLWQEAGQDVPPVFIVVCSNTSVSKLVHDYIAGFHRENDDGSTSFHEGRLELFSNYDQHGNRLALPRTLLIDSSQLESGDALDASFRDMAADELDIFRRELNERFGAGSGDKLTDQAILREVMNTVGKPGRLGASIRCVVSVSMLTEGWDANTVTHILGVRAFGTQLLCEQVVGRGLRRKSYELNEDGLFDVEYADVLGIPFDFTVNQPPLGAPKKPAETVRVYAVPEREHLEIRFPRVEGYRTALPPSRLQATFSDSSRLELNPEKVGPSVVHMQGIIGGIETLTVQHLEHVRKSTILFNLTTHLIYHSFRDPGGEPKTHLFGQLKRIVRDWLDGGYLTCKGRTFPAMLMYRALADEACDRIADAITERHREEAPIQAMLDPFNPAGSTAHVGFNTSKSSRWDTSGPPPKCHLNLLVLDSDWEGEFCRVAEAHPRVLAYVKNQGLGFEVPYRVGDQRRRYVPDFILRIDDGEPDPLNLVVEISGYPQGDKPIKAGTMRTYWVPGVNNIGRLGRWDFAELTDAFEIDARFDALIMSFVTKKAA